MFNHSLPGHRESSQDDREEADVARERRRLHRPVGHGLSAGVDQHDGVPVRAGGRVPAAPQHRGAGHVQPPHGPRQRAQGLHDLHGVHRGQRRDPGQQVHRPALDSHGLQPREGGTADTDQYQRSGGSGAEPSALPDAV